MPPIQGSEPLAPVRYVFSCQGDRRWQVRRFELHEALSEPYRLAVELTSEEPGPFEELLGAGCTLQIERAGGGRRVHGIVVRVESLGAVAGRSRGRVEVRPALQLSAQRRGTRFWQGKSAPQIVAEVLKGPLAELGRSLLLDLDESAYRPREYCVQYRETDLEFAARLMREEGIVYMFEHDGDAERLVLLGSTVHARDLELTKIPFVARGTGAAHEASIDELAWARELGPTTVTQRDWDWRDPSLVPHQWTRRGMDDRGRERVRFDHDDRRLHADDGELRARHKLEGDGVETQLGRGGSDVAEMTPGRCFEVHRHPELERDGRYLLLAVVHTGEAPEAALHDAATGPRYHNEFRCVRPEVPYRAPQPPARPRVYGPHTAIVVGPEGEEIHTDEHGRIKVRFHWDRTSPLDDSASCWIRVAQTSAGPGWGALFLPRVGMEVLVEFIDGDPDRPVVTGCVYNALARPPYELPEQRTRSGIKSESSPGGGGYNEIRFEDAKGGEQLYVRAQRDLTTRVLHDAKRTVDRDALEFVGRDRTRTVGNDEIVAVTANQDVSVGADQTLAVVGDQLTKIKGSQALEVGRDRELVIRGDDTVRVGGDETVAIEGTSTHTRRGDVAENLSAALTRTVAGECDEKYERGRTVAVGLSQHHRVSETARLDARKVEQHAESIEISAGDRLELTATEAEVGATTVALTGVSKIELICGASVIRIDQAGITLSGGAIKIGGTSVDVTAAIIKLN
jgi:type VI secretion system secreted protein VgrG